MILLELIETGILQGLILAVVALGVMIPFRLVNFPDLTAEGSYPLGAAACASLLISGVPSVLATGLASVAAGLLGVGTALVHLRFRINTLLAGIILSTMIYSVNLRLMNGPNIALFEYHTLFAALDGDFPKISAVILIILALVVPLFLFLITEKGLCFRAVGMNPSFCRRQGISIAGYTLFGLFLGNGMTGLAGGLMVQLQSYVDIGMGIGIVIHALAALMIGESIIGNASLKRQILAPLLGALIYQQIQGGALALGLPPSDLKFLTGAIVLSIIAIRGSF